MNENEIRREQRITRKVLDFLDRELEDLSKERLTGSTERHDSRYAKLEILIALSKERRALLRMIRNSNPNSDSF